MRELIVVATTEGGLEDTVSPVFGRAPTYTLVEVEGGRIVGAEVIRNPYQGAPGGAGIQAAQFVAQRSPRAVIAGNFGPSASGILAQAGIELVPAAGITVRDAVERYLRGELAPTIAPGPGFGMGRGRGWGIGYGPAGPPRGPSRGPEDLKGRIEGLERELKELKRKLDEIRKGGG